jgi:branched-chain amino acid transport system ATP-binding protein
MAILEVDDVTKKFGEVVAVDGVTADVEGDELTALIGPNGAGKTTFFNVLSGMYTPSSGTITFRGTDITGKPPHEIASRGLTRSFQITNVFRDLTVFENARISVQRHHVNTFDMLSQVDDNATVTEEAERMLDTIGLLDKADLKAAELSYGQKRKLEIALSIGTEPEMLLMDEPTAGLALDNSDVVTDLIRTLSEEYPILFVEHDMDIVFDVADTILVMGNGELIASGRPDEIRTNERVKQVYLGEN